MGSQLPRPVGHESVGQAVGAGQSGLVWVGGLPHDQQSLGSLSVHATSHAAQRHTCSVSVMVTHWIRGLNPCCLPEKQMGYRYPNPAYLVVRTVPHRTKPYRAWPNPT